MPVKVGTCEMAADEGGDPSAAVREREESNASAG